MVTVFLAHSDYIAYFNELVGGSANGQNHLVNSNFDWGQSGKLLKKRVTRVPVARIGYTLFAYSLSASSNHPPQ